MAVALIITKDMAPPSDTQNSVSVPKPTLVLVVGPFDPSGAGNLPADAVTCAAMGGHALSTLTAVHVQDTVSIENTLLMAPDLIDDQARCLLEDMTVQAIKVGPLYSVEAVRVMAQIAADYSDVPLVLQPDTPPEGLIDDDPEDILAALFELLLPQTDAVIVEHNLLTHWITDGLFPIEHSGAPGTILLECGAKWALITGAPLRQGHTACLLHGPEHATFNWPLPLPSPRPSNASGPLGCALAVELGRGKTMPAAAESALGLAQPLINSTFQPGMGNRLINRSLS